MHKRYVIKSYWSTEKIYKWGKAIVVRYLGITMIVDSRKNVLSMNIPVSSEENLTYVSGPARSRRWKRFTVCTKQL